jgi:ABC-type lipoprotein release transport system permease subunit
MLIPFRYNLRSLRVRWMTTLVTAVSVGLSVTVFVAVMALAQGLRDVFVTTGAPLNIVVLRQGSQTETNSIIERARASVILTLDGIARNAHGQPMASPELTVFVNQARRSGGTSNVVIRGLNDIGRELRPQVKLTQGRWFTPGKRELTVSRSIAERFEHCGLGEQLGTGRSSWTVVGIFDAGQTAYGSEMWTDVDDLGNAFNRGTTFSSVLMRAEDAGTMRDLAVRISDDRRLQLKAEPEPQYYAEQTSTSAPIRILGNFIGFVMAFGSIFAAMNTMYAAVSSRVREIAVLRVLGFSRFSVLTSFLLESLILAGLGGLVGGLLALPLNGLATGTTNFLSFSEMTFQFHVTPSLLERGMIFALVMGAAGGILPAARAARQRAAIALRAL